MYYCLKRHEDCPTKVAADNGMPTKEVWATELIHPAFASAMVQITKPQDAQTHSANGLHHKIEWEKISCLSKASPPAAGLGSSLPAGRALNTTCVSSASPHSASEPLAQPCWRAVAAAAATAGQVPISSAVPVSRRPSQCAISAVMSSRACSPPTSSSTCGRKRCQARCKGAATHFLQNQLYRANRYAWSSIQADFSVTLQKLAQ